MRKKTIFFVLALLSASAYANTDLINKVDSARNSFEREERLKEEREIQKLLKEDLEKDEEQLIIKMKDIGDRKYLINDIKLIDSIMIDEGFKKKLIAKYNHKKLGISDIYNLAGELTNEYIKRGYTTTKVTIPLEQNLGSGILKLKVVPGKIQGIGMDKMNFKEKLSLKTAFPTEKGDYLNLFNLEQGILNLNNSVYNNAKMKLIPGEELGETIVYVENEKRFSGVDFNYNNSGQESTGREKVKLSFTTGDLIVNDNFNVSFGKSLTSDDDYKYNKSLDLSYDIPYKFWKFGVSSSYSKYLTTINGVATPVRSSGNTLLNSYKIERVLGKIGRGKLKFETSLNLKTKEDYINERKIEVSSRNSSNLKNKLSYVGRVYGGSLYGDLAYTAGLKYFGASKDMSASADSPRSDFNKYNLNIRWAKPFNYKKQFFTYEFSLGGQYSEDILYSQDKFSVGDDVSVRGFESGVSGENGYYLRNQVSYNLASLTINKKQNKINNFISKLSFYTGFDYGMTRDKENKGSSQYLRNEELFGMGTGIQYYGDYLNWELSYFKGLNAPDYIQKDNILKFNINFGF